MGVSSVVRGAVLSIIAAFLLAQVPSLFRKTLPQSGAGFAAPGWRKVADVYRKSLDSGQELGSAFALYHNGQLAVEFAGGYADYEASVPWDRDTIGQIFSSAKGIAAVTMAILVDRGLLEYERPVADYWPEFAQNGKAGITVEQLLSHQGGLAVIDVPFSVFDLLENPDNVGHILAAQTPNWTPGTSVGYHGHTLGLYMDQLVRRVDPHHRDLPTFFAEEVAKPLGLTIYFGLPPEEHGRCARIYDFSIFSLETLTAFRYWPVIWAYLSQPDSLTTRSIVNPSSGNINNPKFRSVWNPSTHAFGTAVSLAKLYGILADGGRYEGKQFMTEDTIKKLNEPLVSGDDLVLKMNLTYGRGTTLRQSPSGSFIFGTPGAGGQMVYCDPERGLAWSYITNYHSVYAIGDDPRYLALEAAIYESFEKQEKKKTRQHG